MYDRCSENKGADQLHGYLEAGLRFVFAYANCWFSVCKLTYTCNLSDDIVMYDSYLLKDVHSVLVNFPREYAQESMMLYI